MNRCVLLIAFLSSAMLLFSFLGCEGPAGPQGPSGANGQNGQNGVDGGFAYFEGFKDSLKCGTCHTPDLDTTYYVKGRELQWERSGHNQMEDFSENRNSCAECHTTEGFIQKMNGQTVTVQNNPTPVGCFACHSPHLRGDFSLRNVTPVSLASNITGVAASSFDYGKGNLCVQCHHPRTLSPTPDPTKTATTDTLKITSSRFYAHYGVQGQILMGAGGFQFQGYTYTGNSFHSSSSTIKREGCIACHMADADPSAAIAGKAGGHTMKLEEVEGTSIVQVITGCKASGCHGASLTSLDYNGRQTLVQEYMDTLKTQLVAKAWIDTANTIQAPLNIVPASRSGALFNYMLVLHDGSEGVHNTKYILELLQSSIAELRKP
jgi:mono/diheme cytochrome c family protein